MFKKNKNSQDNFLLYIPVRHHEEWIEKEDTIYLIFHHEKLIEKFIAWLVRKPKTSDVKLDHIGSKVWKSLDGKNTVYDIGQLLLKEYGQNCEPIYKRLIMYLRYLSGRGWIKFEKDHLPKSAGLR